jgi:hypothetical protein
MCSWPTGPWHPLTRVRTPRSDQHDQQDDLGHGHWTCGEDSVEDYGQRLTEPLRHQAVYNNDRGTGTEFLDADSFGRAI